MDSILQLILTALADMAPSLSSAAAQKVISLLEQIIPLAVTIGESLARPIQNIIAALQNNGNITADQMTALAALDAQCDAAFESAATADGDPAPAAASTTTSTSSSS